jgi:leucine dehydrogenase
MVAIHSTARGPSLGGCRMWSYDDVRRATLDVLRLSRAMTYKAACANLALGGGKGVIALPPGTRLTGGRRRDALLDFGDVVETLGGRYLAAEDVGIGSRDMPVMAERTAHVTGLATARGGSGDPSPFTAIGVEAAIRTVCERLFGSPSLEGRTVAVLGLGHVGSRVARLCARAGAQLVVTDMDPAKRALAERLGARWTTPGRALTAKVDVLSPCALGAVFDADTVPKLRCRAIAGAANNQLATESAAELLAARGILWAPDFVVNAGGIVNIAVELRREGYDAAAARRDCRAIGDTLAHVFDAADAERVTPLVAANALAERRLRGTR